MRAGVANGFAVAPLHHYRAAKNWPELLRGAVVFERSGAKAGGIIDA
jgi:hypothetical protein